MIKEDFRAKEVRELYDRWSNAREDSNGQAVFCY